MSLFLLKKVKTSMSMMLMTGTPKTLNQITTIMTMKKKKPSKAVSLLAQKTVNGAGQQLNLAP